MSSIVAKKKKDLNAPGDKRQPGATSTELRRLMSDPLADLFSEVGVELYEQSVKSIQAELSKIFEGGVKELSSTVTKKLGEYGYEESKEHFRRWMNDIVADVVDTGMAEIVGSLDSLVSSLSATYSTDQEGGMGDLDMGGDLMGMDIPEVPSTDVEEITEEPTPEETPAAGTAATPLESETPAATATPAQTGGEMATGVPEAKASVVDRTFKIPPRLQQIYAASKQRFRLQRLADARIDAETK
jgi:hypothetical protein